MTSEGLAEGTLLNGRYHIKRALGQVGMGTVYLAEHVRLDTVVAIKEVRAQSGDQNQDRLDLDRCEHEARFLVRLNHPHLPKVTDAFVEEDRFYLVMEYIEGVTLESLLKDPERGALDVGQVIEWGLQISDVLAYLHSQEPPIIFRDMKPANVMLQPDGQIRLIDFGIARRFQPGANKDTSLLGSVGYSPPEQFGRQQTDMRSDIYAFGATLHHLLTGRDPAAQPFKFPPVRSLNPRVPETLSQLIAACLALDPENRPASVHEVAQGLLAAREDLALMEDLTSSPAAEAHASSAPARRIVSSELAKFEAQKRRADNRTLRRTTSRRARAALVAALLTLVVGGGAFAVLKARSTGSRHKVTHPHTSLPSQVISPPITQITPDPSPPADNFNTTEVPPADGSTLTVMQGQVTLEQGVYLLPIIVRGIVRGHAGSVGTVAVFFYDASGTPINALDRNSSFANVDGHLSVATRLNVTTDEQPFTLTLEVPLRQFPPQSLMAPIKYRGLLQVDGEEFHSSTVDLTIPPTPDSGNSAGSSGADAPANSGGSDSSEPANPNATTVTPNSSGGGRPMTGSSLIGGTH